MLYKMRKMTNRIQEGKMNYLQWAKGPDDVDDLPPPIFGDDDD
jgi:hypothetical protein